jgi:cell division protease FtsH
MRFAFGPSGEAGLRDMSERTAREIDEEIRLLVETPHNRAHHILEDRHAALTAIADELVAHETMDGSRLREIAEEHSGVHARAS